MRCSQIRKMISPYVDDELTADEETLFTSHVADCPACKKEVDEVQSVRRLFASVERSEAPPGFATRVMAHLEEAEEAGLFSRLRRLFVVRPLFLRTVEIAFALVIMLIGMCVGEYARGGQDTRNARNHTGSLFSRPVRGRAARFNRRRLHEAGGDDR